MDVPTSVGPGVRVHRRIGRLLAGRATWLQPIAAVLVVAAATELLHLSHTIRDTNQTLQVMGFDQDRAALLAAFTAEAIVVPVAVVLTGAAITSGVAGIAVGAAAFSRTFLDETRMASTSTGAQGSFDAGGWLLSVLTLGFALAATAWATASLSLIARRVLRTALTTTRDVLTHRRPRVAAAGPIAVAGIALLVVVTVPILGDMLNYDPDVRMLRGGPAAMGLAATGAGAARPGAGTLPAPVLDHPGIIGTANTPSQGAGAILADSQPWRAWQPSGAGSTTSVLFPAPWVGGTQASAQVSIYLPPGYGSGSRRYPVLYEVPWAISNWTKGIGLPTMLDSLIDSGQMPATIVVFVSTAGGPFPDDECANSADHREWFDRFITTVVVPWVDQHERTIATAAARAVFGFSQGGFCASMLALQHPDVFESAIAFSGYAQAGLRNSETPNAWRVYGGNPALEAANSPVELARRVPSVLAHNLLLILSANPNEAFYGPQYAMLATAAHDAGIPVALFPTPLGHHWTAIRYQAPAVLATLGERWAALGVFA